MTEQNNPATSLKQLSVEIAQEFLQSAVILDDQAIFRDETAPTRLIAPDYVPTIDGERESGPQPPSHYLDAKLLVDSFADRGLVCSVFKPREGGGYAQRIKKIAAKADIVILDWTLFRESEGDFADVGNETLRLIGDILENDESSSRDQNRLIAVYTAEPNLKSVTDKIESWLIDKGLEIELSDNSINSGRLRISVISKNQVDEGQLPLRLITDFASMIYGLLPNVAVSGLAALRNNTYQLLSYFSADMDPAYLGQRLWTENPVEAEQHIVSALAGEIQVILEDSQVGDKAGAGAIHAWLDAAYDNGKGLKLEDQIKPNPPVSGTGVVELACEIVEKGWAVVKGHGVSKSKWDKNSGRGKFGTRVFAATDELALNADKKFAALLSLKRLEPNYIPVLSLGTIVARDTKKGSKYWLCLQPRCDSVRLCEETYFPFLQLVKSKSSSLINCLVQDGDYTDIFKVSRRISDLRMVKFPPDEGVVRAKMLDGKYLFGEKRTNRYRWVGELKPQHAQRVANIFAAEASRVGLTESEWLRTHP